MMINRFEDRVNAFYCDSIQNSTTEWGGVGDCVIEFRLDYTKTQDRIKNLFQKKIRNKQIKPLHKFYHFFLFIYLFISFLLLLI